MIKTRYGVVVVGSTNPDCPDGSLCYMGKEVFETSLRKVAENYAQNMAKYTENPKVKYCVATITWEQSE